MVCLLSEVGLTLHMTLWADHSRAWRGADWSEPTKEGTWFLFRGWREWNHRLLWKTWAGNASRSCCLLRYLWSGGFGVIPFPITCGRSVMLETLASQRSWFYVYVTTYNSFSFYFFRLIGAWTRRKPEQSSTYPRPPKQNYWMYSVLYLSLVTSWIAHRMAKGKRFSGVR
jgi:hypothetical protein